MTTLIDQLATPENLLAAWRAVRGNIPLKRRERAAGLDGVTLAEYERNLQANLAALREQLRSHRYAPVPPARIEIPKQDGSRRIIGILTVTDRVAQRAAHQVLEPLFEPFFLDCSYGFRPGRSTADAIHYATGLRRQSLPWVVDGDIANCFDSLDHDLLIRMVQQRVKEQGMLDLLRAWLDAGVIPAGLPSPEDDLPPNWWQVVKESTQTGFDWTLEALMGHTTPGFTPGLHPVWTEGNPAAGLVSTQSDYESRPYYAIDWRQEAMKRLVLSGMALGLSGLRSAAGLAAQGARNVLSTPQGRRLLRKGALTTGGVAGTGALLAAGALYLYHRTGQGPAGTLQGSPLSPLLANIYLHAFDYWMTGRKHHLVRYADDWLILCSDPGAAEAAYEDAARSLGRLKLRLNPVKTRLVAPADGFTFLGIQIKGVKL
jgi:RNA-directed DNA polymerase